MNQKPKMKLWKKISLISVVSFIALMIIGGIFMDKYKIGIEAYNKKDYKAAYRLLKGIDLGDKNFVDASIKTKRCKAILDSLEIEEKHAEKREKQLAKEKLTAKIIRDQVESNKENQLKIESNSVEKNIPGLQPVDVYLNFEQKGYVTERNMDSESAIYNSRFKSNGIDYTVVTYCEGSVNTVKSVRLNAIRMLPQYNSVEDMKPFLKYGCSIPYDGSNPEKINSFIDNNYYKNNVSIVISGVKFTLYAPTKFVRMIDIEKEN